MEINFRLEKRLEGDKEANIKDFHNYTESVQELLKRILQNAELSLRSADFIRDMSLVYLVVEFESFLKELLKVTFQKKPQILASSEKTITYEELVRFNTIEDALNEIIEKEASKIVNEGIEKMNRSFNKKFKMRLSDYVDWEKFKERFYRRNIIVHNNGVVNKTYKSKTGYTNGNIKLIVTESYLEETFDIFQDMSFLISGKFESKFKHTTN